MSDLRTLDAYGVLIEPATLKMERLLPGPIERVWAYLTEDELRRQWLAAGQMELIVGVPFQFVWHNDTLSDPPGERPPGAEPEHRLDSRVLAVDPPRKLSIAWEEGEVTFELATVGDEVLLTLVHRRLADPATLLDVAAGWHVHLDVLVARARGETPAPFWERWRAIRAQYEKRLSA